MDEKKSKNHDFPICSNKLVFHVLLLDTMLHGIQVIKKQRKERKKLNKMYFLIHLSNNETSILPLFSAVIAGAMALQ